MQCRRLSPHSLSPRCRHTLSAAACRLLMPVFAPGLGASLDSGNSHNRPAIQTRAAAAPPP
eukprot:7385518-Prymnesium_polylepis.1